MSPEQKARAEFLRGEAEVRQIVDDPVLHNRLYLVRNNVPFDVAFSLDSVTARGWSMSFAKMDGHEWDWDQGDWKKRPGQ